MNCGLYGTLALISPEANPQDKDLNVKWFIGKDSQEHRKWGSKSEKESKSQEEREQKSRRILLLLTPSPNHTSQSSSPIGNCHLHFGCRSLPCQPLDNLGMVHRPWRPDFCNKAIDFTLQLDVY